MFKCITLHWEVLRRGLQLFPLLITLPGHFLINNLAEITAEIE